MTRSPDQVVSLFVWTLPRRSVPMAVLRAGGSLRRQRARTEGLSFAKLLGTSHNGRFGPRDANLLRWAVLSCGTAAPRAADVFERRAEESWRLDLAPVSSTGQWSRASPFRVVDPPQGAGRVAVITRATLRPSRALRFWRAVPPVASELAQQPGLRIAFGMGEAPIGLQGTFSVWDDNAAMARFAYRSPHHKGAISDTQRLGWYREQLFARFVVLASAGTIDGRDPAA